MVVSSTALTSGGDVVSHICGCRWGTRGLTSKKNKIQQNVNFDKFRKYQLYVCVFVCVYLCVCMFVCICVCDNIDPLNDSMDILVFFRDNVLQSVD